MKPDRFRMWSITSSLLEAVRRAAVPAKTMALALFCLASSTISAIACPVRSIASSDIGPSGTWPSPRRVSSARSTTACPFPVGGLLGHMELDRVGADVDDRVPRCLVGEDGGHAL